MGEQPEIEEIRQQEQSGTTNDGGSGGDGGDGGGMFDGGVPSFGLSRRQMLLIALVVVLVLAWKLRDSDGSGSGSSAQDQIQQVKEPDLGDVKVREEENADEPEVVIPANPDDELEKDQAVIDYFKDAGHIDGGDDE